MGAKGFARRALSRAFGVPAAALDAVNLDGVELVTFDVFDTLVRRACGEPGQVFDVVEGLWNEGHGDAAVDGFRRIRERAELTARRGAGANVEVTIDGIYERVDAVPGELRDELMGLEMAVELAVCEPNAAMVGRYDRIRESRRVAIVSDTYLPEWLVAEILRKCGIAGYERLFVSSQSGVMKRGGGLFELVASELALERSRCVHVGDHPLADWIAPRRVGMRPILYSAEEDGRFGDACGRGGMPRDDAFGIDDSAPQVSVVVPVYNSAAYLPAMLDGLLGELGVPFEVILVDDGSTDGSGELVDSYAARDPRVVAAHQGNSGLCAARNAGLRLARGEYVTFCDDDDLVLTGFVSDNYRVARDADADCVRFGVEHRNVDDGGRVVRARRHAPKEAAVVRAEWMPAHARDLDYGIQGVWSGLYRTRVIREHGIAFEETFRQGYEDCLFNDEFMVHARSYALNPSVYYAWLQRNSHSASTQIAANGFESVRKLLAYERAMLGESGLLSTDPGYCARRLFRYQNGFLARGCFEPRKEPLRENAIYEMCRESLVPHREVIDVRELDPLTKVLVSCLFNRRYRALCALIWAGVWAQRVGYRISAVGDAVPCGRGLGDDWRS